MKKIALFMAIAVAAIACKPEETVVPQVKVLTEEDALVIPNGEGDVEVTIESNVAWTAEFKDAGVAEWCSFTPANGEKGTAVIKVSVDANTTGADRIATIVVTAQTAQVSFDVTQGNRLTVTPSEDQWLPIEGGSVELTVAGNIECNVTAAENDWLTMANEGGVYKFTAGANESFNYRSVAVTVTPKNEAYADMVKTVNIFQNGRATKLWTKNPTLDFEGFDALKKVRLAKYGDYILLANTTKVYALNPADGSVVTTFNFPEGMEAPSFCVDDAGNIVVATDCAYGGTMGIYSIADPTNPQPELIKDWNTGNYYGNNVGNLRIKGNIKENAVMTALVGAGAGGAVMMWKFENGACTTWYGVNPPYEVSGCEFGCAAPLGTTFEEGLLYVGYGGDYNVKYLANPVLDNYTDNAWVTSYVTGYSWMENTNCITTAEYNGKKYAAYTAGCHFNYDSADAILLDITDPAAAKHVYTYNGDLDVARDDAFANLNWTGMGTYSDILLVPTADALLMVYVDSNFNGMSCIAIK